MIIKSLSLENIRSYTSQEITFDTGINFLSGDIGSGKSSILLAVEFALFGFKRGDLEGFQLLRKGASQGSVLLTLIDPKTNSELEIFRKVKKAKNSSTISQDTGYVKFENSMSELSPQEMNSMVFELLNFPKEFITKNKNLVYRFTTYTPQEQLKEILYAQNEDRLEVIRKLFNIDKYKQLKNAIGIYLQQQRSQKQSLQVRLEQRDEIAKEFKELKNNLEELTKKELTFKEKKESFDEKSKKYVEQQSLIDDKQKNLTEKRILIEKQLSKFEEIKVQKKEREEQIQKITLELEDLKKRDIKEESSRIEEQLEDLKKNSLDFKKQHEAFRKERDSFKEKEKEFSEYNTKKNTIEVLEKEFDYMLTKCQVKDLEVLLKSLGTKKRKKERLEKQEKDQIEELALTKQIILTIKENREKLEKGNKELEHLENCTLCKQEISIEHKKEILKVHTKEVEELSFELKELEKKLIHLEPSLDKLKKEISELKADERIEIELEEKYKLLKKKEEIEKEKYDKLRKLQDEIKTYSKKELLELDKKKEELDKSIEKLTLDEEKNNEERQKLLLAQKDLGLITKQIEEKEKQEKEVQQKLKKLLELLEKEKSMIEKQELVKKSLTNLQEKKDEFQENKNKFETMLKEFISEMSQLKTQKQEREKRLDTLSKKIKEFDEIKKQFEIIIKQENLLSKQVFEISDVLEKTLFTSLYVEFNEEFERFFRELIEDNEIEVRLDEEFAPIIEQNGYDVDIKNLSGGEKSSLAVAYRLSLKKVIETALMDQQRMNMLILDEPTDGFSNEQVDRLGSLLKESDLDQILLVSHDEKVESIADHIIKIEKINHTSTVL